MAGVKGMRWANRKEGPRSRSGHLITWRDVCACGHWKTAVSARCQSCNGESRKKAGPRGSSGRLLGKILCHCGQTRTRGSVQCLACTQKMRRARQMRTCEQCKTQFYRKATTYDHDARRFCSRTCWGKWKRALYLRARDERRGHQEWHKRQKPCLECGHPLGTLTRRMHPECFRLRRNRLLRDKRRELHSESAYQLARHPPTSHVCPTCGESFTTQLR